MATMKAAVMTAPGSIEIEERTIPEIGPDDVLVRVGAVGICGSDVHYYATGRIGRYVVEKPIILGHESAGTVVAVGSHVTTHQVGDRVAMEPGIPCRRCEYCKSGRYNLCPDVVFMATPPVDGAFCEYYACPADFAFILPDNVSLEAAAMIEPLACGLHAVHRAKLQPGESVAIFGAGPIGLMALQAARAYNASTRIIIDPDDNRLQLAAKIGATATINPNDSASASTLADLAKTGIDVVIEASGAPGTSQRVTDIARRGGRVVFIGLPGQEHVPFSVLQLVDKELDVLGVFRYANVYPQAIQLLQTGQVDVTSMITHHRSLEQTGEAMEIAHRRTEGAIKVIITP